MEQHIEAKGSRARLTCAECHRRKIRCDKQIPCGTCIKRGLAEICSRDSSSRAEPAGQHPSEVLQALLDRVAQLEGTLRERGDAPAAPSFVTAPQNVEPVATPNAAAAHLRGRSDNETVSSDLADDADAPVVLEFLSWGRSKNHIFDRAPENESGPRRHSAANLDAPLTSNFLSNSVRDNQLDVLEALMPTRDHVLQLVRYHKDTLVWYHGSYSPYIFDQDLDAFYQHYYGNVRHAEINLQWLALFFSIIAGSITCASKSVAKAWGFSEAERVSLAANWYNATTMCLNMANYIENHTIYSVQAIATLTISAHILGLSDSQSVLLASAGRIAQSLGLHRLGAETKLSHVDVLRKRETGRRLWAQLCLQDWFSVPFSESYSLNPRFCDTSKPLNCNEQMMEIKPLTSPTEWSYCIFRCDLAALMPQLQDAMEDANTLFTRYERVLEFDDRMRKIATASMPTFLMPKSPVAADWPAYVPWARRSLTICAAHKIIMIHRKFLGLSFSNSAFSFTRRTCIAASKTILKEARAARDEHGPVLWIDQAFTTASGIILSLDAFHRQVNEPEFAEHKSLVQQAIQYLDNFETSRLAMRGVKLLSYLMAELEKPVSSAPSRKRPHSGSEASGDQALKRSRSFSLSSFMQHVSTEIHATSPNAQDDADAADIAWDAFADLLPPYTGFGNENLFDDIFNFQT